MSELVIQSGKLQGKRLVLPEKDMVVGRDDDCDVKLSSSLVSRKHCVLRSTADGILVTDLSSQNGTFVNDLAISKPTLLRDGDILRIGAMLLAVPSTQRPKGTISNNQTGISDADIADWLTDTGSGTSGSDTAVISTFPPQNPVAVAPQATPAPKPKAMPTKVLSVKDEAAAVIRKHWEAVKAMQSERGG